ncbi:MAG: hypothetical protein ACE3L7_10765 [Candidatus Pristimantibacillus sp.]
MNGMKWFGLAVHLLLGALFPFILVGGIILIYGFMTPPTLTQRLTGIAIAVVYGAVIIGANIMTLRRLPESRNRWYWLLMHVIVWVVACILIFIMLRIR